MLMLIWRMSSQIPVCSRRKIRFFLDFLMFQIKSYPSHILPSLILFESMLIHHLKKSFPILLARSCQNDVLGQELDQISERPFLWGTFLHLLSLGPKSTEILEMILILSKKIEPSKLLTTVKELTLFVILKDPYWCSIRKRKFKLQASALEAGEIPQTQSNV